MNAHVDRKFDMDRMRDEHRAHYPLNQAGERYCDKCGHVLGPEDWGCNPCSERRARESDRKQRIDKVKTWFFRCNTPIANHRDLAQLPGWRWARFGNEAWRKRCDPRVVSAVEEWDHRKGSLGILKPTGGGATSSMVAWVWRVHDAALAAAESGETAPCMPSWIYCSGLDLSEAAKRRRLGNDEHELVSEASNASLLFLDELGRHTPADLVMQIADRRYADEVPTVWASGMTKAELATHFGAACIRRLVSGGRLLDCHPQEGK
jgi:hypothetical protein